MKERPVVGRPGRGPGTGFVVPGGQAEVTLNVDWKQDADFWKDALGLH